MISRKNQFLMLCLFFWTWMARPWIVAKFFAAWEEYQKNGHYRARLAVGFSYALDTFFQNKGEQEYMLKIRLKREPWLKWRIIFFPWSIPTPAVLETAARSGVFSPNEAGRF